MDQLEKFFEDLFLKKVSWQLPQTAKEVIVKIAPWLALIAVIFSIPAILTLIGLGSFVGGFGRYYSYGSWYYLGLLVVLAEAILLAMAFSPLRQRLLKGWRYVYYAELISGVYSLITAYSVGNFIWSLIGIFIGLYIIFQVKNLYK